MNPGPPNEDWASFTSAVLGYFRDLPFPVDQFMIWTIHDYGDIRDGTNLAQALITRLKNTKDSTGRVTWNGFSLTGTAPGVLATEGGYRMAPGSSLTTQAQRLQTNWMLMKATDGMLMATNYETWSNVPPDDTGLCVIWPGSGGAMGPASWYERQPTMSTWANLPTTGPR